MGLTRSMLKGMGLTDEQIGAIIEEHINVVDGLKQERDKLKDKIDSLEEIKDENKNLKEELKGKDDYQKKYEKLEAEYSDFKKEDGYKHSIELSKEYGLYRQDYCGCKYSISEMEERKW